jgi:NADH-quinone oxidoreductase subunit J
VTGETIAFGLTAVILLASSLAVVLTRNLFHSILYLAVALVATGVVFLLLDSAFLFGVQLLLYAGGVVTIVVFAIMLTERLVGQSIRQTSRQLVNGAIVAGAVLVGVVGFLVGMRPLGPPPPAGVDMTPALGLALVGPSALTLQLLGVLLVVALVGALYFARDDA